MNRTNKISGAEAVIRSLIEGVDLIYGYPGGAIMPIYDELYGTNKLNHVLTRHEQGATHQLKVFQDFWKSWSCYGNFRSGCNKFSYWNC